MRQGPAQSQRLAPLFDRLMEWVPGEAGEPLSSSLLDERALLASVRHEVAQVLGTRCPLDLDEEAALEPTGRSTVDYGLPDVGTLGLESAEGIHHLERIITHAVSAFEPRLEHVQVTVQVSSAESALPAARLTARLVGAPAARTLCLPLRLDRNGRLVEVGDAFEHPEG